MSFPSVVTPEDFGAAAHPDSPTVDDTDALDRFFNSWTDAAPRRSVRLAFSPGRRYVFTRPLVIAPPVNGGFQYHLDGNGAVLDYRGPRNSAALTIGTVTGAGPDPTVKSYWSTFQNFHLHDSRQDVGQRADVGLHIRLADFLTLENIQIGGFGVQIEAESANSMTWRNVHLGGGRNDGGPNQAGNYGGVGARFGDVVGVFSWTGGKVQQLDVGFEGGGSVGVIEAVDFSLIDDCAVHLRRAGNYRLHIYTEKIGHGIRNDTAAVVRVHDCSLVEIAGALRCVSADSGGDESTNAAFGVEIERSHGVTINAVAIRPQRHIVSVDDDCRSVVLESGSHSLSRVGDEVRTIVHPFAPTHVLEVRGAQFLPAYGSPLAPNLIVPVEDQRDMSGWDALDGAVQSSTVSAASFDGLDTVPVLALPTSVPHGSRFRRELGTGSNGTIWTVEGRMRVVSLHADAGPPTRDMAVVRVVLLRNSNHYDARAVRLGEGWQDFTFSWEQDVPGDVTLMWGLYTTFRGFDAAVDFVRVRREN